MIRQLQEAVDLDERMRKRVVAFGKLTADQKCQLHSFIASFGY